MFKNKLQNSDFIRNSLILILGTGVSQIIPVALQFPLRKIYTPEEFGTFAVYMSIVSILSGLAHFKYANTIVIPEKDEDGLNLLVGSVLLSTIFSIFIFVGFFFFSDFIIYSLNFDKSIKPWLLYVPISVFLISGHLSFSFWLTRKKQFKGLAINKVARRGTEGFSQYFLGKMSNSGGLMYGTLIGDVFNFFFYLFQIKKTIQSFKAVSLSNINVQLKKFSDFPKYSLIPSFFDTFSLALPVFLITSYYSEEITGQYDLTVKMLSVPLALISLAISQVLLQKIAEGKHEKKSVLPLIRNNFLVLGFGGAVGIIIFYFFGETIFSLFFGDNWLMAGKLSAILVFSFAVRFTISPLTSTFVALEKIKISSVWQICYFLLISSLYLFKDISIEEFILIYVYMDVVAYSVYGLLIYVVANNHDKKNLINVKS
jgi:O-antigen/teichoic acid export membrane protein